MMRLRPVTERDLDTLMRWRMMPEVTAYMFTDPVITRESQAAWYEAVGKDPTCRHWILELDGQGIGSAGLTGIDTANSRCYWFHYIADPDLRGKGLGTALECNVLDHTLLGMGLNKLGVEVLAFNTRAIALHAKCGSKVEGVLRQHVFKGGAYHDVVVMSVLRHEWLVHRGTLRYPAIIIES